ncbi:hypothetical protein ACFLUG_04875 [Chloroflexota bacterium]
MRAIIFGNDNIVKKLSGLLVNEGIEVESKSFGLFENINWGNNGEYDLAIVDGSTDTAVMACENIREYGNVPIALLVDPKQADWKMLGPLNADCYIPEINKSGEMAARLRATLRRFSFFRQDNDKSGGPNRETETAIN